MKKIMQKLHNGEYVEYGSNVFECELISLNSPYTMTRQKNNKSYTIYPDLHNRDHEMIYSFFVVWDNFDKKIDSLLGKHFCDDYNYRTYYDENSIHSAFEKISEEAVLYDSRKVSMLLGMEDRLKDSEAVFNGEPIKVIADGVKKGIITPDNWEDLIKDAGVQKRIIPNLDDIKKEWDTRTRFYPEVKHRKINGRTVVISHTMQINLDKEVPEGCEDIDIFYLEVNKYDYMIAYEVDWKAFWDKYEHVCPTPKERSDFLVFAATKTTNINTLPDNENAIKAIAEYASDKSSKIYKKSQSAVANLIIKAAKNNEIKIYDYDNLMEEYISISNNSMGF